MNERADDIRKLQDSARPIKPINELIRLDSEATGDNLDGKQKRFILLTRVMQDFWNDTFADKKGPLPTIDQDAIEFTLKAKDSFRHFVRPEERILPILRDLQQTIVFKLKGWLRRHQDDSLVQRLDQVLKTTGTAIETVQNNPTALNLLSVGFDNVSITINNLATCAISLYRINNGKEISGADLAGILRRSHHVLTALASLHMEEFSRYSSLVVSVAKLDISPVAFVGPKGSERIAISPHLLYEITQTDLPLGRPDEPTRIGCPAIYARTPSGKTMVEDSLELAAAQIEYYY